MSKLLKQSSTAQPLTFFMCDSSDHLTGKTGLTVTVTLSKAGAAFASPSGAVSEIANGWYQVAGNATDTGTLGPLILHATGTGADPTDREYQVVAFDPQSALATPTNITAGTITTVTNLTNAPTAGDLTATMKTSVTTAATAATPTVNASLLGGLDPTEVTSMAAAWANDEIAAAGGQMDLINAPNAIAIAAIQSGLATPTNITAGTITTVTNLTNAPTSGDLTATMKTSITTAATAATPNLNVAYNAAKTAAQAGDAMALTTGERTTLTGVIWAALTSGLTTAGSIGKRFVDFMTTLVYVAPPSASDNADAVWDELQSGHTTAGTYGLFLDSTISGVSTGGVSASDIATAVWANADRTLSSFAFNATLAASQPNYAPLLATSYTAPDNTSIAAIKVVTDQFRFTVANKVDSDPYLWGGDTLPTVVSGGSGGGGSGSSTITLGVGIAEPTGTRFGKLATLNPTTGLAQDADSLPTVVVLDSTLTTVLSATVTHLATGEYQWTYDATDLAAHVGAQLLEQATVSVDGITQTLTREVTVVATTTAAASITPILASSNNPRYSTRDLPPIAQGSAPTEVWTIVDATAAPVDLSGKTIRCVFYLVTDAGTDEVSVIDDTLAASFAYETGGSGITVGGADSNQVTLQHSAANTATAGCYHYFLWNITDNIVLAKGRSPVEPAVKSL